MVVKKTDESMILKEQTIAALLKKLVPDAKLQRIDDLELTISVSTKMLGSQIYDNHYIKNIIRICGMNFWGSEQFEIPIDELIVLHPEVNKNLPIAIDVYIIESNKNRAVLDLIIYQNENNLYFGSFIIKKSIILEPAL